MLGIESRASSLSPESVELILISPTYLLWAVATKDSTSSPGWEVGSSQKTLKDAMAACALVSSHRCGAEELVSFLERCLHLIELSQLAGVFQP